MILPKLAIKRPVTILMCVLIVLLLGSVSLSKLNIDLYPKMDLPVAAVITQYEGVGPKEVETLVTKPIEEAIGTVNGLKKLNSTSSYGSSIVIAQFEWGTDMNFATLKMREKIDMADYFLPDDISSPMVVQFDPSLEPIMVLGTSGKNMRLDELQSLLNDKVKNRLERIDGVASVDIYGGDEREIKVLLDQAKMEAYGLSIAQVSQALRGENMNLPGGSVQWGDKEFTVRTTGQFTSVDQIANTMISLPAGGSVYIKDVAKVIDGIKDRTTVAKMNGTPSISIVIQKQTSANTVKVAQAIKKELEQIKQELPGQIDVKYIWDQSTFIERSINNMVRNAVSGAILAVLILFLFLRNVRSTLVIGTAIPISIITAFILMYFSDLTLNLMTMGGLALGVGMLVDNSIVVLENIYRYREEGFSRAESALKGTEEVGTAVIASTLTTCAVFLPIVFTEGIASQIFRELALTVSLSLVASLIVALSFIPMLSSKILRVKRENGQKKKRFAGVLDRWESIFGKTEERYLKLLAWSLGHRKRVLAFALGGFILSIALVPLIGMEFIPGMDQGQFSVSIKMPYGTPLSETAAMTDRVVEIIQKHPEVDTVFSTAGGSNMFFFGDSGAEESSLDVRMKSLKERKRSTQDIVEDVRKSLAQIPGAEFTVTEQQMGIGSFGGSPVSISIRGSDFAVLEELANQMEKVVASVDGTREVSSSFSEGRPELQLHIKRDKAAVYGLGVSSIASSVQAAVKGQTATIYREGGKEVNVVVRLQERDRKDIDNLRRLIIQSPMGMQVQLSEVADIVKDKGPISISRENQERVVTVNADIAGRDLGSIMKEIQEKAKAINLPQGYLIEYGGQNKEMVDAFGNLALALVLAILLVYMILASQFESLIHPFTIMFSVPLSFIGVALGLLVTHRTLSVPSFIGIIMLAGIVVNNAIVLVDYINTLRGRGMELKEAILKAGPTRLRPIMMTMLTTVLGLVPLALGIGEGAETAAGMATVVIGGLLFSTLLTLIVIPVLYTVFDGIGGRIKNGKFGIGKLFRRRKVVES
jgi:HAE1 family hydrophobic/amphiphilic exporter-1